MKKIGLTIGILILTFGIGFGAIALYKNLPYFGAVNYVPAAVDSLLDKTGITNAPKNPTVTFTFAGDIMLDRGVEKSVTKNYGGDFSAIFKNTADFLHGDDITFLNLEGPASDKGHNVGSIYSFEMNPDVLPVVKNAGIDVVSFANNHVGDYTKAAFVDTMDRLTANGIPFAGAGKSYTQATTPTIVEKNGIKVGFLGFTDVGPYWLASKGAASEIGIQGTPAQTASTGVLLASDPNFADIIAKAKTQVDVLVVSFHWGVEYKPHTDRQAKLAHTAIDAGADIIVGAHPHVAQDLETYKGKLIMYSLGNFVFDQYFSKETMQGLVVRTTVTKDLATGTFSIGNTTEYINQLNKDFTLASILPKYPEPKTSSTPANITFGWVGDVPPSNTAPLFDQTVLTALGKPNVMIGNLEGALGSGTSQKCVSGGEHCYSFVGGATFATLLKDAGFDFFNLSNNHALDKGESGVTVTQNALTSAGLMYTPPIGTLTSETINGVDIGFLSFGHNAWTTKITDLTAVRDAVRAAAAKYSVVVILFHGGAEGATKNHVPKTTEYYIGENRGDVYAFSHTAIDAGADLVLGSGPHVIRGIEKYNDRLIVYSAGNFLTTEGMNSAGTLGKGALFTITTDQNGVFKNVSILSTTSQNKNTVSVDPENEALNAITSLTKQDFGEAITADENGLVTFREN